MMNKIQAYSIVGSFKGKVSLFARNLDTGEYYGLNPDERVRTASTIKIAVMIEAFARVAGKSSTSRTQRFTGFNGTGLNADPFVCGGAPPQGFGNFTGTQAPLGENKAGRVMQFALRYVF